MAELKTQKTIDTKTKGKIANSTKKKSSMQAVGKRKSAVARVRLSAKIKDKAVIINGKKLNEYFNYTVWQKTVLAPFEVLGLQGQYGVSIKVQGGGPQGQAEAIRHGISRILVNLDDTYRKPLKAHGFLTRDPRVKERKKPGLKRARRAPQWQKR